MHLYLIEPEVAGGLGKKTKISNAIELSNGTSKIPIVEHLEYAFDDWNGEDLLESFPCYIITNRLLNKFADEKIQGVLLESVTTSKTDTFFDLNEDMQLPLFVRLMPEGYVSYNGNIITYWSGHDVCLSSDYLLFVSERCIDVLNEFELGNATIKAIEVL